MNIFQSRLLLGDLLQRRSNDYLHLVDHKILGIDTQFSSYTG